MQNIVLKASRLTSFFFSFLLFILSGIANSVAGPYSGLYVFGDSLSDTGNVYTVTGSALPSAPYFAGRFTNGLNYAEQFATNLGLTVNPSLLGGSNFSYGGARSNSSPFAGVLSYLDQINSYQTLNSGIQPNALYLINIGGNDMLDAIKAAALDPLNATTIIQTKTTELLTNVALGLNQLDALGADHFIVANLLDVSKTPAISSLGNPILSTAASQAIQTYNAALDALLAGLAVNNRVVTFDTFTLFNELLTTPPSGITNTTDACLAVGATQTTLCSNPNAYIFWDDIHPTATIHTLSAQRLLNTFPIGIPNTALLSMLGCISILAVARKKYKH